MSEVKVSVTFRHTRPTDALKHYAEEKIHKIGKHFPKNLEAHVILSVESKARQLAEVTLQTTNGVTINGKEQTSDLYSAIDLVMDKVERQVQKQKEKFKGRRRRAKA